MPNEKKPKVEKDEVDKMGLQELRTELKAYKFFWERLDPKVKELVQHHGRLIRIRKRDYKDEEGVLVAVTFEPTSYVVKQDGKFYLVAKGGYWAETRNLTIQAGSVYAYDLINQQTEVVEKPMTEEPIQT